MALHSRNTLDAKLALEVFLPCVQGSSHLTTHSSQLHEMETASYSEETEPRRVRIQPGAREIVLSLGLGFFILDENSVTKSFILPHS